MRLANRIRKYRKKRKLTLRELGKLTDLAHTSILGYEKGKWQPNKKHHARLAKVLNVDEAELFYLTKK